MITFFAMIMLLASLGVVSWPLMRGTGGKGRPLSVEDSEMSGMLVQKDETLFAISELEADYEMGTLSAADYRELRSKYEEKAMALIKNVDALRDERGVEGTNNIDEEIEAAVSSLRARTTRAPVAEAPSPKMPVFQERGQSEAVNKSCHGCGAQLKADDLFCSRCGTALSKKCPGCSATVASGDGFCFRCGAALTTRGDRVPR